MRTFPEPAKSSCGRLDITEARKPVILCVWTSVSLVTKELLQWHEAAVSLSEPYLTAHIAIDLRLFLKDNFVYVFTSKSERCFSGAPALKQIHTSQPYFQQTPKSITTRGRHH